MILTKTVKIKWRKNNIEWYTNKGYIFTKISGEFEVKVEDLTIGSHIEIEILCNYCLEDGVEKIIPRKFKDHIRQNKESSMNKDCCIECLGKKNRDINILNYGVENQSQRDEIKQKIKTNCQEKYGVDYTLQIPEIREKIKQTNIIKYGGTSPIFSENVKDKMKQTNMERYGFESAMSNILIQDKKRKTTLEIWGVEYPSQNSEVKDKIKKTNNKKYGVDYYLQSDEFKIKYKETSNARYGTNNPQQNKEIQEKSIQTRLSRYGFKYYSQTDECKEKFKVTSLINWGTEHPMQNPILKARMMQTLYENGTCPTSSQQLAIYNMLKENNYNVELNYPLSRINLDVAIFIDDIKIDLEYDCAYWHKDAQKDRRRDEYTKSQGWKILRIRSGHKIPTLAQLEEAISKLVDDNGRKFVQITLDDWKIEELV